MTSDYALPDWVLSPKILIPAAILLLAVVRQGPIEFNAWRERSKPLTAPQCYLWQGYGLKVLPPSPVKNHGLPPALAEKRERETKEYERQRRVGAAKAVIASAKSCPVGTCTDPDRLKEHKQNLNHYLSVRASRTFIMTQLDRRNGLHEARRAFNTYEDHRVLLDFRQRVTAGLFSKEELRRQHFIRMLAMRPAEEFRPCDENEQP